MSVLKSVWLKDNGNDNVIVGRGFRDVIDVLSDLGYDAKMPPVLPAGKSQRGAVQSNNDRSCSETRWIVESYHGRLKNVGSIQGPNTIQLLHTVYWHFVLP